MAYLSDCADNRSMKEKIAQTLCLGDFLKGNAKRLSLLLFGRRY